HCLFPFLHLPHRCHPERPGHRSGILRPRRSGAGALRQDLGGRQRAPLRDPRRRQGPHRTRAGPPPRARCRSRVRRRRSSHRAAAHRHRGQPAGTARRHWGMSTTSPVEKLRESGAVSTITQAVTRLRAPFRRNTSPLSWVSRPAWITLFLSVAAWVAGHILGWLELVVLGAGFLAILVVS